MGLSNQVRNRKTGQAGRYFVFKEGVPFKHMTGNDAHVFRVQPAFDPANPDPATSCIPYITPDNELTDWARLLYVARFIGHGRGGWGTRQDLLSLKSFDQDAECPLYTLHKSINQLNQDWGYLMEEDRKNPGGERKAFSRPIDHLVCNIYDLNQRTAGNQLACFTKSATDALIDGEKGLCFQRVARPQAELDANYLAGFAVGDMTHPSAGPALVCQKESKAKGDFSGYDVNIAVSGQGAVIFEELTQQLLGSRYNMLTPETFLNIPTEEELVQALVQLLNMRSPRGYHEHALLREVFPTHNIPEPPSAPGASPTIAASGFGGSPAAAVAPPITGTVTTGVGTPGNVQPGGAMPGAVAAAAAAPVQPAPVQPAAAPVEAAPVQPAAAPAEAAPVQPAAAAPVEAAPTVPGDAVPAFNKEEFMGRLKTMGQ